MTMFTNMNCSSSQSHESSSNVRDEVFDSLVSDQAVEHFGWFGYTVLSNVIDIFGIATNIMNIICFVRMGFKDAVNVSLLGLAISDIGCLATLIWTNICMNPAFMAADLSFDPRGVQYLTSSWPHVTFTRVTAWITAFISLERCLCITLPLKVKSLITPRRVCLIIVCIFVIILSSGAPVYFVNKLVMIQFPARNRTILALAHTEDRASVEGPSFAVNVFVRFSAYGIIIMCTIILVLKLRQKKNWREQSISSVQADRTYERDMKVTKMVVIISSVFIACFLPVCIVFIAMSAEPEFYVDGQYKNINTVTIGVGFMLESVSCASNIFIYFHMSTKFRATMWRVFCA